MVLLLVLLIPLLIYCTMCLLTVTKDADEREEELIRKMLDKLDEKENEK